MEDRFIQKTVALEDSNTQGKIKVATLCELIENHPYKDALYQNFEIEKIKGEFILIDHVDTIFDRVKHYNTNYHRHNVLGQTKDINVFEEIREIDGKKEKVVVFHFEEYVVINELRQNLTAVAKYD